MQYSSGQLEGPVFLFTMTGLGQGGSAQFFCKEQILLF